MRKATKAGVAGLLTLGLMAGTTAAFASADRHQSKDAPRAAASVDKTKNLSKGRELKSTDPVSSGSRDASSRDASSKELSKATSPSTSMDPFSKDRRDH